MLAQQGLHPVLAQLYAARGVVDKSEVQSEFSGLIPPERLLHAERAAALLADAIETKQRLLIVADYDCDGATACAVGVRALSAFGADVAYLVPNRFEYGYGLTPEIVDLAARAPRRPDLLITVDNGIASNEGVARANELGIATLITDHHLPGDALPQATCIVNPNQPGCDFPSKAIAGVGVMFYVMLALRAELRRRGWFKAAAGIQSRDPARPGGPGHGRRRGAAGPQQPHPGGAGLEAHPRRQDAGRHRRAACAWPGAKRSAHPASTWVSPPDRGSTRPGAWPTWRSGSSA